MPKKYSKFFLLIILLFFGVSKCYAQLTYLKGQSVYQTDTAHVSEMEMKAIINGFIMIAEKITSIQPDNSKKEYGFDELLPVITESFKNFVDDYANDSVKYLQDSKALGVETTYKKILQLGHIWIGKRDTNAERQLEHEINGMAFSKEKVWLILNYLMSRTPRIANPSEIDSITIKAKRNADLIKDLYEKGLAYFFIGYFEAGHESQASAILSYYKAKEFFYNSAKSDSVKNTMQGFISEKIAEIFLETGTIEGTEKAVEYFISAATYFGESNYKIKASDNNIASIAYSVDQLFFSSKYQNDSAMLRRKEANLVRDLEYWYIYFDKQFNQHANERTFNGLSSIGHVLYGEGNYKVAKQYYLYALLGALRGGNLKNVYRGITEVSLMYALLKNEKLAHAYADLAISFAEKLDDRVLFYKSLLMKEQIFYAMKNYDSVKYYADKITRKVSTHNVYQYLRTIRIHENAYRMQYEVLSTIHPDAIWKYRTSYLECYIRGQNEFTRLIQAETIAISNWLGNIKSQELRTEEKNRLLEAKVSRTTKNIIITIALVLILSVIFLYLNNREKSARKLQDQELEKLSIETENKISRLKIQVLQGQNHEFSSLVKQVSSIAEMQLMRNKINPDLSKEELAKTIAEISQSANMVAEYVRKYYQASTEIVSTISQELDLAESYLKVFQMEQDLNDLNISIVNEIGDESILKELLVPSHLLNIFISNSIKHGLKGGNISKLEILVRSLKTDKGYIIAIEDNGCGINYTLSNNKGNNHKSTGIELAQKIISEYNKGGYMYKIHFPESAVVDRFEQGSRGTIVSIEFIKTEL